MALIKCSECGKEISDKAKTCVNCGSPIEAKIDISIMKEWEDLTNEEKRTVLNYRKNIGQLKIGDRASIIILYVFALFLCVFALLCMFFIIPGIICFILAMISLYKVIPKQDKEWYDKHKEELYKKRVLSI